MAPAGLKDMGAVAEPGANMDLTLTCYLDKATAFPRGKDITYFYPFLKCLHSERQSAAQNERFRGWSDSKEAMVFALHVVTDLDPRHPSIRTSSFAMSIS